MIGARPVFPAVENANQLPFAAIEFLLSEPRSDIWVEKPWGKYSVIHVGDGHQIKLLVINPGHELSLQLHRHRSEHWVVLTGRCGARIGEDVLDLNPGDTAHVSVGMKHRLTNLGQDGLKVLETQFGKYLSEDDIERFEDRYGRV
jgi:mannose-1-phosphate guanylyltransferase / mannose-6-phosphate isomerase